MLDTGHLTCCRLAKGGMGSVELAVKSDEQFTRLFAVKRLHPHLSDDPQFEKMFLEEARIAGMIEHPNVVSVVDVGRDKQGPYLVMNFVDGVTLNVFISKSPEKLMPLQVCLRISRDIAKGLAAAHDLTTMSGDALNLVHRDLSPQNVLIGYDGSVRITDFGIAKAAGRDITTATSVLKGKISYMSPEQLRFENPDSRSDLFALGVLMFELLSGQRLYPAKGDQVKAAQRILHESPPDIGEERTDLPPEVVSLMFRLLAKNRESRPASASEVADILDEVIAGLVEAEGTTSLRSWVREATGELREPRQRHIADAIAEAQLTYRAQTEPGPPRPKSSNTLKWGIGLTGLLVVIGLTALFLNKSNPTSPSEAGIVEPAQLLPETTQPPIKAAVQPESTEQSNAVMPKEKVSSRKTRKRRRRGAKSKSRNKMKQSGMDKAGWVGWGSE